MFTVTDVIALSAAEWLLAKPSLTAAWGARAEEPAQVADRLQRTLRVVRDLGGIFDGPWLRSSAEEAVASEAPADPAGWTAFVEGLVARDDAGTPAPEWGYDPRLLARAATGQPELLVTLDVHAGQSDGDADRPVNQAALGWTFPGGDPTPVMEQFDGGAARETLSRFVEIWRPNSAAVRNIPLIRAQRKAVPFSWPSIGAISWLSGDLYDIPDTVPGAVVERHGQGTLLTVGSVAQPSIRLEDVMPVFDFLREQGHIGPAPAEQPREPDVSTQA